MGLWIFAIAALATSSPFLAAAERIENTEPLALEGDPAASMVEGITKYLLRATEQQIASRRPSVEALRKALGVIDRRVPFQAPEIVAAAGDDGVLAGNRAFRVYAVRWPVLDGLTAEGLLFRPLGKIVARVVTLPDADQTPEQFRISQALAAAGCEVLSPVLINRQNTWSGNPRIRMTNQPHREYIYRMAFMAGRHVFGYEVQKTLAVVDWFAAQNPKLPIGVWGYGEGGAVALFSAALDDRITAAVVSGYFQPREQLWKQPLYRNVFGFLKNFGDAELAGMIAPRTLIIETTPAPVVNGPSEADPKRRGAAAGELTSVPQADIEREVQRARSFHANPNLHLREDARDQFLQAFAAKRTSAPILDIPSRDNEERQHRQFAEMVDYTQQLMRDSHLVRDASWAKADSASAAEWEKMAPVFRAQLWDEVIGRLPKSDLAMETRTRRAYSGAKWDGYDVMYDTLPDVIGYGVLLLPKDIPAGQRRPVVVAQHGLEGRPQHLFGLPENEREKEAYSNFHYYQNIGSKLADLGYIVYMPQNPYIGDFRKINRLANPLGLSLFSFILAQHDRILDWLSSLPQVDPKRIGFYGLSYGGKTAVRVPPLLDRYALSICSGDFNEWVYKVMTVDAPYSYMFTHEWEIPEFNLAHIANHAEMAKMMAPRPFMVERGHRDGVGTDEWVAFEYAKAKRFYDEKGIGDRTEFEYFNGPHMIHGVGTIQFIRKHFGL